MKNQINYVDGWGRYHHKPVTKENPTPSNNGFLYSGYAYVLGLEVRLDGVKNCFLDCLTKYGYTRHPIKEDLPLSSHDEIVGMFMLLSTVEARGMVRKYVAQHWQLCNLSSFEPKKWRYLNPFKVAKEFWKLSREENPRNQTFKYPYIWPIIFKHRRHHVYFYNRCALARTGFWDKIAFGISSLFCTFAGSNSSKVQLGFKFMKLLEKDPKWYELMLLSIYDKRVNFGEEVAKYFPKFHPIPQALKALNG